MVAARHHGTRHQRQPGDRPSCAGSTRTDAMVTSRRPGQGMRAARLPIPVAPCGLRDGRVGPVTPAAPVAPVAAGGLLIERGPPSCSRRHPAAPAQNGADERQRLVGSQLSPVDGRPCRFREERDRRCIQLLLGYLTSALRRGSHMAAPRAPLAEGRSSADQLHRERLWQS